LSTFVTSNVNNNNNNNNTKRERERGKKKKKERERERKKEGIQMNISGAIIDMADKDNKSPNNIITGNETR